MRGGIGVTESEPSGRLIGTVRRAVPVATQIWLWVHYHDRIKVRPAGSQRTRDTAIPKEIDCR